MRPFSNHFTPIDHHLKLKKVILLFFDNKEKGIYIYIYIYNFPSHFFFDIVFGFGSYKFWGKMLNKENRMEKREEKKI